MTPEFDKVYEGLWANINKAKKKGKTSSKWKNDPKYRKQMKKQADKITATKEGIHDPVRPGILKRQTKGKLTCTKARALKSKQKNKGNNTAKAAQRYLNYHCEDQIHEAEYRGRKVKLNKPMRGDVKKFKVYVKDPKTGNVKKVNFGHGGTSAKRKGEKTMRIKKSNPKRRKSFRARHNCDSPGPKTKARYWSCRKW